MINGMPQPSRGIADAATIDRQVDHLAVAVGCSAPVLGLQEKDPPLTLSVLTPIALGPVGLLACLDDLCALRVGTLHARGRRPSASSSHSYHARLSYLKTTDL